MAFFRECRIPWQHVLTLPKEAPLSDRFSVVERITGTPLTAFISPTRKGNVWAVTGVKGGSGRTSISLCLAIALAERGNPVFALNFQPYLPGLELCLQRRRAKKLPLTVATMGARGDLGEMDSVVKQFSLEQGHVVLDLPPQRGNVHQVGLLLADRIVFATRADNELRMWTEKTRDMVEMARNLEVPPELEHERKPCYGVMTDFQNTHRGRQLLRDLKADPLLTWKGVIRHSESSGRWLASGRAPWECSKTPIAIEWKSIVDSIIDDRE